MRVAVVYVPGVSKDVPADILSALVSALGAAGHQAELLDAGLASVRLASFDYIVLGTAGSGLGGRIPSRVSQLLAQAQGIQGKRSLAFVRKSGLRPAKALSRLMAAMEAEGMYINDSRIISGADEAVEAASTAPVERN